MESNNDNLYARWLAGQIDPKEAEELQASGELEGLEAVIATTDKLALPKYDAQAGYARFKGKQLSKKTAIVHPIRRLWPALAAAASVVLLIGIFWLINGGPDMIKTGNTLTLTHTFSDQTTVVLNDGSSIVYEEGDWEVQRSVQLIGEAIFNVQKGKPFIVNTSVGTVEVLGTSFNVRAWHENLNVECYEGQVRVRYSGKEVILTAGESVAGILGNLGNKQPISHEKPFWSRGTSKFNLEPTYRVLEELARQYDVKVITSKIEQPFIGSFPHNNLEDALDFICRPMNLKYSISTDKKTITIKG